MVQKVFIELCNVLQGGQSSLYLLYDTVCNVTSNAGRFLALAWLTMPSLEYPASTSSAVSDALVIVKIANFCCLSLFLVWQCLRNCPVSCSPVNKTCTVSMVQAHIKTQFIPYDSPGDRYLYLANVQVTMDQS